MNRLRAIPSKEKMEQTWFLESYAVGRKRTKKADDEALVNILGTEMTKGELRAQRKIRFEDCTPLQQAFIRGVLRDSFTQEEVELMGKDGLIVRVGWIDEGKSGSYRRRQRGTEIPIVVLDPELNEDTITHEFVHHARVVDPSRRGYAKTAYRFKDGYNDETFFRNNRANIHNFEEAATVAETTIRTKKPANRPPGYYGYVKGISKKAAYESDRKKLVGMPQSSYIEDIGGIKGRAAINRIEKEFPNTHIASMAKAGITAIQSYEELNKKY